MKTMGGSPAVCFPACSADGAAHRAAGAAIRHLRRGGSGARTDLRPAAGSAPEKPPPCHLAGSAVLRHGSAAVLAAGALPRSWHSAAFYAGRHWPWNYSVVSHRQPAVSCNFGQTFDTVIPRDPAAFGTTGKNLQIPEKIYKKALSFRRKKEYYKFYSVSSFETKQKANRRNSECGFANHL